MLKITSETLDGETVLHCCGGMTRGEETTLLCFAASQEKHSAVLDLALVDTLDAAGIGALVSLQAAGIYLQLRSPSTAVREALARTGTLSIFEIRESPTAILLTESSQPSLVRCA